MILQQRDYRRLVNRFINEGDLDSLEGGGMRVRMDGANFIYEHKAVWFEKDFIANDVLKGKGWRVNLLDTSDGGKGRMLTEVSVTGDREKARRDMRLFLNFVYY